MVWPTLTCQTEATLVPTTGTPRRSAVLPPLWQFSVGTARQQPGPAVFSRAHKNILPDGSVNAPVGIDNLGDAEIGRDRHQGDRFILTHAVDGHEKAAKFSKGIAHRLVEARMVRHIGLGVWTEFGEVVRKRKAVHRPLLLGFQHRMREPLQYRAAKIAVLVQDEFEVAGQRGFDRGPAEFAVALGRVRIADREKAAWYRDRIIHPRALADAPVVDIAAGVARRNRTHEVGFRGR